MLSNKVIKVFGKVQGVAFRDYSSKQAKLIGIKGSIRNEPDGTVLIEAEGEDMALKTFINWCYQGSPRSNVNRVVVKDGELKNYDNFDIIG